MCTRTRRFCARAGSRRAYAVAVRRRPQRARRGALRGKRTASARFAHGRHRRPACVMSAHRSTAVPREGLQIGCMLHSRADASRSRRPARSVTRSRPRPADSTSLASRSARSARTVNSRTVPSSAASAVCVIPSVITSPAACRRGGEGGCRGRGPCKQRHFAKRPARALGVQHMLPPATFSHHPHAAFQYDGQRRHPVAGSPQYCAGRVTAHDGGCCEHSLRVER
jgi:hypothetical protein